MTLEEACLMVARHYHPKWGEWAYEMYEKINARFFGASLPWPHISWGLTAHGKCLGYTHTADAPVIVLHRSLWRGTEKSNPWGVSASWLGPAFAFDVLVHEAIHVSVECCQGGWRGKGKTSHNNDAWIAEVNRLAPLLGLHGVEAGRSRIRRVPIEGPKTPRGKPPTKAARVAGGNVPFGAVATFPYGMRQHLGMADDFYRTGDIASIFQARR
jgi:hypothetical protein